ncbi:MAG: hypothetical protein K6G72_08645, partial [Lachnospiraceae bacterium]|nr:hypothetical protein [Lachnospiraceae bacterium]
MLTNKDIRKLPLPEVTKAIKDVILAKKKGKKNEKVYCVTYEKIGSINVLNFFTKDENMNITLRYRFFFENLDVKTQDFSVPDKVLIKDAHIANLRNYNWTDTYKYVNSQTKETVEAVFNKIINLDKVRDYSIPNLLSFHAWRLRELHEKNYQKKRREQVDEYMRFIKPLPSSFEKTVQKSCEHLHKAFYNRKKMVYRCTGCNSTLPLPKGAKRNATIICEKCRRKLTLLPDGTHLPRKEKAMAVYIQAMDSGRIMTRYFDIDVTITRELKRKIEYSEVIRKVIDFNKHEILEFELWWNHLYGEGMTWAKPIPNIFRPYDFHYPYQKGEVHQAGLTAELRKAGLDRLFSNHREAVREIVKRAKYRSVYSKTQYFEMVCYYPQVERLTKCKLWNLACYYSFETFNIYFEKADLNFKESSLEKALGVNKTVFNEIVKCDPTYKQLSVILKTIKGGNNLRSVSEILDTSKFFHERPYEALQLSKSCERKLRKYITANNISVSSYFDYYKSAVALEYNMASEMVLYPKDFMKAH